VKTEDGIITVTTAPEDFERVFTTINNKNIQQEMAEVTLIPDNWVKLEGENLQKAQNLIEKLEENDDVQNVYHNLDLPEEEEE
jgi:transcriptional/translational regulatory protein YebC/TACO1